MNDYNQYSTHKIDYIEFMYNNELIKAQIGDKIDQIIEHMAGGEGDKFFYSIYYKSGRVERVFTPIYVSFIPI